MIIKKLSTVALAVLAVAICFASPVQAANCAKNPNHPQCNGGGGGEPVSQVPINVQWDSFGISEPVARPCTLSTTSGSYGSYHCQHIGAASVTYDLSGIDRQQIARKGDPGLCESFDGVTLEPNSSYQIDWEGECNSAGCTIRILNAAYGEDVSAEIPGVGMVWFEAFADISEPSSDPNPFADPQTLKIDYIEIDFRKEGTNKTIAKCRYTPIPDGQVEFTSTPAQ